MKMIDRFTNLYPLSKTLQFSLLPVGETEKNFEAKKLLDEDKQRAEDYKKVKTYLDRYHRAFIEDVLSRFTLEGIDEYAELYYKPNKTEKESDNLEKAEATLRAKIVDAFKKDERFASLGKKEMIQKLLPDFLTDDEEKEIVASFRTFTTYFTGFFENRANMYSAEAQTTAISNRCINENLPKFLDNAKNYAKIKAALSADDLAMLSQNMEDLFGIDLDGMFVPSAFSRVLAQSGIDAYNQMIGGYTAESGTKVQGLNEYINLYNQQVAKGDRALRLPFMKPLFKQILSESDSVSFIPDKFKDDTEALRCIAEMYLSKTADEKYSVAESLAEFEKLFADFDLFDMTGIHLAAKSVTELSNAVFGYWGAISDAWNDEYSAAHPAVKNAEKWEENRSKAYKSQKSFNLADLQRYGNAKAVEDEEGKKEEKSLPAYYTDAVRKAVAACREAYARVENLLTAEYTAEVKLAKNDAAILQVRTFLDALKAVERLVKPLCGTGKEEHKDDDFYGRFLPLLDTLRKVDRVYDRVRNHVTQKPYSKEKIKLNFGTPQLLGGWDRNKERDYHTVLLEKDGLYYLAVMDSADTTAFLTPPCAESEDVYRKMEYKLLPGPNKMLPKVFFARSNIGYFNPSPRIMRIYNEETFKKGNKFDLDDCRALIDFYKTSIACHEDWSQFDFHFSPTSSYNDISEFYNEVKTQGYKVTFTDIPASYIDELVASGKIYLFQIYNKDFSPYSHGKPNLHTLYFKALFDAQNLADVVYQLNGGAEMFYRPASIRPKEIITHPKNQPIRNKGENTEKATSTFTYDLVKDRRFTKPQFSLHLPITLNFKANDVGYLNDLVREELRTAKNVHIIGIDRGERNLLYISVINGKGEIVEQYSLNEIVSDNAHKVDYHTLLENREDKRTEARQSWTTIEGIKELKEGYLSQVVHKICELVVKYDAIIVLEDLNSGFKNSRAKVERSVYQKFETMLAEKLRYLVDKSATLNEIGGLLHARQLTNGPKSTFKGRQNGIIFYIPAWNTSKIDPTTGFVDLLKPRYTSEAAAKEFVEKFDRIGYNPNGDWFEFSFAFDENKFPGGTADYRKKWTVCTYGERIRAFRNGAKNNEWDNETVRPTEKLKELFAKQGIALSADMKTDICAQSDKKNSEFWSGLMQQLALTLQMRNSITGRTDVDYLISPVRNADGKFYDSREADGTLPVDADANGAYNIARKGLWAVQVLQNTPEEELGKANLAITNRAWLEFAQKGHE